MPGRCFPFPGDAKAECIRGLNLQGGMEFPEAVNSFSLVSVS